MSRAESNGRFDLDAAAAAAAAEDKSVPFAFKYRGEDYETPAPGAWPLEAQRLIGVGELGPALALLLGEDSFNRLSAAGMTMAELNVLFAAIGASAGVDGLPNLPQPARQGSTPT